MVKTMAEKPDKSSSSSSIDANKCGITKPGERNNSDSCKYKGVRKRKWGKWVSEIRLPNSRERIWLGSYDSPVKAARAFDAALFCLRGSTAKFNLPDNPPEIPGGRSLTPPEIQAAAAQFANSEPVIGHSGSGQSASFSSRSDELQQVDSPCPSVSDGPAHVNDETTDASLLDQFRTMGWTNNSVPDFGIFPGFDDLSNEYYIPQPLQVGVDHGEVEEASGDFTSQGSFLWNF